MTAQKAIETIETAIAEVEWNYPLDYAEVFEEAIKALEKQIPKNKTEAANEIYKLLKEFWGDCVSVKISASSSGIDFETKEKPFTIDYSMRTINGTWLPKKGSE